jgi:hypothetical protein
MTFQEILEGITRHRADPLELVFSRTDMRRKFDEIEWALQAMAELLALNPLAVEVLNLQPSDVFVIKTKGPVSDEVAHRIVGHMQRVFPDHKCLVIGPDMDLSTARGDGQLPQNKKTPADGQGQVGGPDF